MGYTVLIDGSIRADSVDDAIALSLRLQEKQREALRAIRLVAPPLAGPRSSWPLPGGESNSFALTPPPSPALNQSATPAVAGVEVRVHRSGGERAELALRFLTAVRDAGDAGVGTIRMMELFGVDQPRGIGSKALMMKNFMNEIGFAEGTAYTAARTIDSGTVFRAGPSIDDAINACSRRLASGSL